MQTGDICHGPVRPSLGSVRNTDSGVSYDLSLDPNSHSYDNLSVPQFLHLQNGVSNMSSLPGPLAA